MSVVSGRIIFCEGKQASLNFALLNRIIENVSGDKPTIVPSGGKFTFSIFAQGYFFPNEVSRQRYLVFRDRDFDVDPTEEIKLLEIKNARGRVFAFLTHRASIENYLLDAELIHNYWTVKYTEKQENPSSKWGHGDSPGIEVLTAWIESSARDLQNYQAVRWALADLIRQGRTQLKTTWTGGSSNLPSDLTLGSCETEATKLIDQFVQSVAVVTPETFATSLVKYRDQFSETAFWSRKNYLIWFHGKDIQKMMQRREPGYIALTNFFNWAIEHIEIERYHDLMALRTKIEEL